jgi:hypothetical protein
MTCYPSTTEDPLIFTLYFGKFWSGKFPRKWIGTRERITCPSRSPDFTPLFLL